MVWKRWKLKKLLSQGPITIKCGMQDSNQRTWLPSHTHPPLVLMKPRAGDRPQELKRGKKYKNVYWRVTSQSESSQTSSRKAENIHTLQHSNSAPHPLSPSTSSWETWAYVRRKTCTKFSVQPKTRKSPPVHRQRSEWPVDHPLK